MLSNLINVLGLVGVVGLFFYGCYIATILDVEQGLKFIGLSLGAGVMTRIISIFFRACARAGGSED